MATRRTHRKSRSGCEQCKRRHIKCDESRPVCANCSTSELVCSYTSQASVLTPESTVTRESSAAASSSPRMSDTGLQLDHSEPIIDQRFEVNMLHFKLLEHFRTTVLHGVGPRSLSQENRFSEVAYRHAILVPFLMHEVLAVAALHLCIVHPEQKTFYRQHATGLQARALVLMKQVASDTSSDVQIAMFIFASLIGMHVLGDIVLFSDKEASPFLESYISYLKLHRGARSVVRGSWDTILSSDLKEMIDFYEAINQNSSEARGDECAVLEQLLAESDMSESALGVYRHGIQSLQLAFNAERHELGSVGGSTNMVFSWCITQPDEYIDFLMQRKPEALVILAYYAALLHKHRQVWLIGDAGRYLFDAISSHLGTYWAKWLEWPGNQIRAG